MTCLTSACMDNVELRHIFLFRNNMTGITNRPCTRENREIRINGFNTEASFTKKFMRCQYVYI